MKKIFLLILVFQCPVLMADNYHWSEPEFYGYNSVQYSRMIESEIEKFELCKTHGYLSFCEKVNKNRIIINKIEEDCSNGYLRIYDVEGVFNRFIDKNNKEYCSPLMEQYYENMYRIFIMN